MYVTVIQQVTILLLFFPLLLGLPGGLLSSDFSITSTYPNRFILPHLINRIVFDEGCMSWRSSLCSFRIPSVSSSLVFSSNFLSTKFSNTENLCVSPKVISSCCRRVKRMWQ